MIAERLRTETKTAHAALEKAMMPLLRASTDADSYARMLGLMHAFLAPVEQEVFAVIDTTLLPDAESRRSASRLQDDLDTLKASGAQQANSTTPTPPDLHDVARAWGALYVLEGSTLGGRVVRDILLRQFPGAAGATRYFDGYGDDTDERWAAFKTALTRWDAAHPGQAAAVVTGADDTFTFFRDWLQKAAHSA